MNAKSRKFWSRGVLAHIYILLGLHVISVVAFPAVAETKQPYRNLKYGFEFSAPESWIITETNYEVFHYNEVFLTVNSWRPDLAVQAQETQPNVREFDAKIAREQLQPGEVHIAIGYFDGPGGPTMRTDTVAESLNSLFATNGVAWSSDSGFRTINLRFFKRGHWWNISAALREPVTKEDSFSVRSLLESFRFVEAPVGSVAWAESLAWNNLPGTARGSDRWPVVDLLGAAPVYGPQAVLVETNSVDGGYRVEFKLENVGEWKYLISTNGTVSKDAKR